MWKKIKSAIGFLLIIIGAGIVGPIVGDMIRNSDTVKNVLNNAIPSSKVQVTENELVKIMQKAAEILNKKMPMYIDEDTRMDRVAIEARKQMVYYYSFPRYSSNDIDKSWLLTTLKPDVKNRVCANEKMKIGLLQGATYVYSYSGNDNIEIARFGFNRIDCGL